MNPIKFDFEIVSSLVLDIEAYLEVAGRGWDHNLWLLNLKLMKIDVKLVKYMSLTGASYFLLVGRLLCEEGGFFFGGIFIYH